MIKQKKVIIPFSIIVVLLISCLFPIFYLNVEAASRGNQISLSALNVGEWITSPNNNYRAVMQGDGNFVVYAKNGSSEIVKWATYTQGGNYYTYRAAMQEDGNFVIYGISSSGNHTALWTSNTAIGIKSGYIYKLILTNEGTLKVVSYSASNNINKTVWSSSSELFVGSFSNGGSLDSGDSISSQNKNYFATMQVDGNFVVYLRNGTQHVPLWYTSTQGESFSSYKAFMQQDGNFVIYGINSNGTHQALWSSGTAIGAQSGYSYKLCITDDGNLQIIKYNLSNQSNYSVIWSNNNKISLNVVNFKQYDSRWKDTYIGNSNAKIGKVGCLVTSIAMLYNYETKNSNVYPYNIDEILGLTFSSTGSLNSYTPLTNQGYGTIRYNNGNGVLITQDMMKLIYNKLKDGHPVIIGAEVPEHYVVITGYQGTSTSLFSPNDFLINDPGSASNTTLNQFLSGNRIYVFRLTYKL